MKIALTGWNGFLATKLRESTEFEWQEELDGADMLVHMGSPTFTQQELFEHDAQVMHQYVRETIKLFDRFQGPIVFASTTGVDDIKLDHTGTTSYNLGKLYLENYLMYEADKWAILRIGTIISRDPADVEMMKPDRIQPRIQRKDMSYIEWKDHYLFVDDFVKTTLELLRNFKTGIVEYPLTELTLPELAKL